MIKNKNRSYYFGASDTKYVIGNWETKSFEKWWLEKLNLYQNNYTNEAMITGTIFEHKILDSLEIPKLKKDKQIKKRKLRLRVNLDGNTKSCIYEVKTYNLEKGFNLSKAYIQQVQIQMYITKIKRSYIVAYGLKREDYKNYFNEIDKERINYHKIEYDNNFIENEYLPKLKYLSKCLKKGTHPKIIELKDNK